MNKRARMNVIAACMLLVSAAFVIFIGVLDLLEYDDTLWSLQMWLDLGVGLLGLTQFPELPGWLFHGMAYVYVCFGIFDVFCAILIFRWNMKLSFKLRMVIVARCLLVCSLGVWCLPLGIGLASDILGYLEVPSYILFYGGISLLLLRGKPRKSESLVK